MKLTKAARQRLTQELLDTISGGKWFDEEEVRIFNMLTGFEYTQYRLMPNDRGSNSCRNVFVGDIKEMRSWNKQIKDPNKEKRDYINPRIAMRAAIIEQYRQCQETHCQHCGATTDLTTDHKTTAFETIAKEFLTAVGGTFETCNPPGKMSGHWIKDPELLVAWQQYHQCRADYQTLCRSCNSKKGNKKK